MAKNTDKSRRAGKTSGKKTGGSVKKIIILVVVVCIVAAIGILMVTSHKEGKTNESNNIVTVNENTVVNTNED